MPFIAIVFYTQTRIISFGVVLRAYMGLTCKKGHYNELIEKLLSMDIPKGNISILYGPIDIFIKIDKLKNLNEFVKKWSTPIRMIGGQMSYAKKVRSAHPARTPNRVGHARHRAGSNLPNRISQP